MKRCRLSEWQITYLKTSREGGLAFDVSPENDGNVKIE